MDMLGILASSLMILSRQDGYLRRDAPKDDRGTAERRRRDRHFWQGRTWTPFDPRDL